MTENCYIHIPFCKSKCNYCAFVSYLSLDKMSGYVFSLLKEIDERYGREPLKTLYLGGGTPSLLPLNLLEKILRKFNFNSETEVTIELNPDDVSLAKIESYKNIGINRFSIGVQSFDNHVLKLCGRRHDSDLAKQALEIITNRGDNVSADLIYGLPSQTIKSFLDDLKLLIELSVTHISLYGLKIEDNTPFYNNMPQNLPDDDMQADMYLAACEYLAKEGFLHYEISNFSKSGYESIHNTNYWRNNSYYGFGVAAHGYVDGFRYYNTSSLETYMQAPHVSEYAHHVTKQEVLEEEIFLGLRLADGLCINDLNKKFDINFEQKFSNVIEKYNGEFLIMADGRISLTEKGFMLSNIILSEFV